MFPIMVPIIPIVFFLLAGTSLGEVIDTNAVDSLDFPPFVGCENKTDVSKLTQFSGIPNFRINLDDPPEIRWNEVITAKKTKMLDLLHSIKQNTRALFGPKVFYAVDKYLPWLAKTLPQEYYHELIGISKAANMNLGEVTLFNVFYEFFSVCTSIVMEDSNGNMYHGRNLDFGLFLGWDVNNLTWLTTEYLRPLIVTIDFVKADKIVYSSVNFAGYVGVLTAVKKDVFSLTVNERFKLNGGYVGLIEWVLGNKDLNWMGLLTREVMLKADSFSSAQKILSKEPLVAPVYFILAGNKSHEGCIITRSRKEYDILDLGAVHKGQHKNWFIVQTNYDHWKQPPFYDNRRDPAIKCMEEGDRNAPFQTLRNVLSTRPVLNKLTTYTSIIEVKSGYLFVELQDCKDPCWPW